ncbi:MAG: molybdopterin oxidoreductase [Deltaproteobacteria bacterium]|nr:molybdopterin oxidoreductase [Deltaproteobacteria bacterium]
MEPMKVNLTIDGRPVSVAAGATLLQAARALGIDDIPTLCHDERLHPYGSCFLCVVEVPGTKKLFPACATEVREGMEVLTRSERVIAARKRALELLLSDHYADCLGPCQVACPAGVDIQGYVALVAAGRWLEAARLIRERNPLPAVCGRVCVRKCEVACRRAVVDGAVGINMVKRFAADRVDEAGERSAILPDVALPTGKRVAVVGAGPAGLACADLLARQGHAVTIFEAAPAAGGMLRYGIPEYRLPRDVLERDIQGILDLGVELLLARRLGRDFTLEQLKNQGYSAIFLGLGAQGGSPMKVAGEGRPGVQLGIDFLRDNELKGHPRLGGRVVVVGGGNTAIDCARTALRCGAGEVDLVYRRTRAEMPANAEEIEAALREGVQMTFLAAPLEVVGDDERGGRVTGLRCQRMELGEPDKSGRRRPVPVPGSEYVVPADHILAAIGQQVDLEGLQDAHAISVTPWKTLIADEQGLFTGVAGVFAGGDVVLGPAVVVDAIGQGRRAAAAIDRFLGGGTGASMERGFVSAKEDSGGPEQAELQRRIAQLGSDRPRAPMPERHLQALAGDWAEVELRLDEDAALSEARRCLSCGCSAFFTCDLRRLASEYGADLGLTRGEVSRHEADRRHAHIELDANKCVLCAKCIRVCEEVLDGSALGLVHRGFATVVQPTLGRPLQETACISCGCCVDVCPTGAIAERGTRAQRGPYRPAWQPLVCSRCGIGCALEVDLSGGQVLVRSRSGVHVPIGSICERGRYGHAPLWGDERLRTPLVREGDGRLYPTSWEEALARAAAGLSAGRARGEGAVALLAAPRLTCEEASQAVQLARSGLHTELVGSIELLLGGVELDELAEVSGLFTTRFEDLPQANTIFLCNADPLADHPVLGLAIRRAARRKATLFGLGGAGNRLAGEAAHWISARRGSASAALAGMVRSLTAAGDQHLPARLPDELARAAERLHAALPDADAVAVHRRTGVAPAELERIARLLAEPGRSLVVVTDPERAADRATGLLPALVALLVATGKLGRPGCGLLLPSRHANLRGALAAGLLPTRSNRTDELSRLLGQGGLQAALLLGEDPLGNPLLASRFARPDFLVVGDVAVTATAQAADVVLPLSALPEVEGTIVSFDGSMRRLQPVAPPPSGRSTLEVLVALVQRLGLEPGGPDRRQPELGGC